MPNVRPVVVIDPGHGGSAKVGGSSPNNATGPNGLREKNLTLDLARRVRDRLANQARVMMTRDADANLALSARAQLARDNQAALFLSIHLNGFQDANVDGTEVWVARNANQTSRDFAQSLLSRLVPVTGVRNRGVRESDFGVLLPSRHAAGTAASLVEIAFLTNPQQARRFEQEAYRQQLAEAMAEAVRERLSVPIPATQSWAAAIGGWEDEYAPVEAYADSNVLTKPRRENLWADAQRADASPREPLRERCGFFGPTAVISENDLRNDVRQITETERRNWFDATGNVLTENINSQFGHLVRYWLARFSTIRPSTLTAAQARAIRTGINYGQLLNSGASSAAVTAEVARVRRDILTGVPGIGTPANLNTLVEQALRQARNSGIIIPARNRTAWSGVFVSACIRQVAIHLGLEAESGGAHVGRDTLLLAHDGHRFYVEEAYRQRFGPNPRSGTYHAFRPNERAVRVGDIVVLDRQANAIAQVESFNNIPGLAQRGRNMHCDIVVEVNAASHDVVTIGGNVSDSVRRRRYPLNATGNLVVARQQLFAQETDNGTLPPVPAASTAAGLALQSTGRIFALLSPVEICAVIPGQRVNGGVIV